MQIEHRPNPPDKIPFERDVKEFTAAVKELATSIREFPDGFRQSTHVNETACGLCVVVGLIVGLVIASVRKREK